MSENINVTASVFKLQPLPIYDWTLMGLYPHDLIGWKFSVIQTPDDSFESSATDLGVVVHCPVSLSIQDGVLNFAKPHHGDEKGFALIKHWGSHISLKGRTLKFDLPFHTMEGRGCLVVTPPENSGLPHQVRVISTCYEKKLIQVSIILALEEDHLVLPEGTPLGHLIPVPVAASSIEDATPTGSPLVIENPYVVQAEGMPSQGSVPSGPPPGASTLESLSRLPNPSIPEFSLNVWRVHPRGIQIQKAEKSLRGDAPFGAVKWCGPFTHANSYGYWVYPPIDIDIIWYGGRSWDHKMIHNFDDEDSQRFRQMERPDDKYLYSNSPRTRIDFGGVKENVVSIWTGCIFQTPPGWGLLIRNPINVASSSVFRVQEGILETDWLSYDIWMNLEFIQQDKWVHIRREPLWPPIAQLVPVLRDAYEQPWGINEQLLDRSSPEGEKMYDRWIEYNYKKWIEKNHTKEPTTYHQQRAQAIKSVPPVIN
jgi:hypothetical protein